MFESASTGEVVAVITDAYREESRLVGRRLAAIAELLSRRTWEAEAEDPDCGYMIVTGLQRTSAEVAAAMNLSAAAASVMVSQADALDSRLPKVAAVLARGDIDWRTVQIIVSRSELVSDRRIIAALDSQLAERVSRWQSWSRKRVIDAVDAAVRTLDRDAVKERERAEDRRHMDVIAVGDGTAKVDGVVDAETAVIFDRTLGELATGVCREDPRTLAQRRADAVAAMAQGRPLACRCAACAPRPVTPAAGEPAPAPADDTGDKTTADNAADTRDVQTAADTGEVEACAAPSAPSPPPPPPPAPSGKFVINVIADQSTVVGTGNRPGYLEGFGVIDADLVRQLAQGATLRPLNPPVVTAEQALRYQPTAAVERFVRMRDLTCRFPGCDRPAQRCDIDHTIAFNHVDPRAGGKTVPENLKCLCRQHHRAKTFVQGWRDLQLPDGTVVWTTPDGRQLRTVPGGVELFPALAGRPCAAPAPARCNPLRRRATRIERRRAKNRALRPINQAHRTLERARRREIEARKDRNRHRTMLMLFKGGRPTKGPFMRWVNEPYESEVLPPDWRPPPDPPPQPDEPPF
ncbi:DUF222 domain-containing protein [Mycobacterium manitobense]|uniref:DUF222 domain-containing protein n=1 Tax=[Mycobacterium] manitobense TaxID=190147 RepID=A0A9X2YM42_9MYCO|nr:HNH endonuclease signature motif containing protein [[Mycobacterium] manitobense]MCV7170304.1 DUF222 domain-containing protein [[Mycobacterium] manitobense]